MIDRLVLGAGPLVRTVAVSLADQPGSVRVLTADEDLADSLREQGLSVSTADPADPSSFAAFSEIDVAVSLAATPARNRAITRTVRDVFSDVYLIAYRGDDEQAPPDTADLGALADKLIDPTEAVASALLERAGDQGRQSRDLWDVLRDLEQIAILTHDNPDPDAIASGVALATVAEAAGCQAEVCYFGDINHQENRAFVNVLDLELRNITSTAEIADADGIALVDHSQPAVNDQLDPETAIDIVIDHHPPRSPIDASFVDLRSSAGATSTLLTEYLSQFGLLESQTIATALLFGIHVDTDGFTRGVCRADFRAAARLVPHADLGTLERIESPSIAPATLETVALAIQQRQTETDILLSCVGRLSDRDALAQAADQLLMLEDVATTVVYGFDEDTIYVSARSRGTQIDLGETLREAFDQIGSAGGHVDMAGAQIELGVLEAVDDDPESLTEIVTEVVKNRFMDAVGPRATDRLGDVYDPDATGAYLESGSESDPSSPGGEQQPRNSVLYTTAEDEPDSSVADTRADTDQESE